MDIKEIRAEVKRVSDVICDQSKSLEEIRPYMEAFIELIAEWKRYDNRVDKTL